MPEGLDLCNYQENTFYKMFIDWPDLKSDPLNFQFIWIKCAEGELMPGTPDAYPIEDCKREVAGAYSVNFRAVNLYHFYYYRVPWGYDADGKQIYKILDPILQAQVFAEAYKQSGCRVVHPMIDAEDPYISEALIWKDTASINAAIAFARKINAHLKRYTFEVWRLLNAKPDIYTGDWWLKRWVPLLMKNGYASEVAWLLDFNYILADYDGELNVPDWLPIKKVIAWQRTSTPKPWIKGIPTGLIGPGSNVDIDRWMLSDEEFDEWCGDKPQGEQTTVSRIFDTSVPMAKRAWGMEWKEDQAIPAGISSLGLDWVTLPMMVSKWVDNSHQKFLPASTFKGRFALVNASDIPVIGKVDVDASWVGKEMHSKEELENHDAYQNAVMRPLMDSWVVEPMDWEQNPIDCWAKVKAGKVTFRPISAIMLSQLTTKGLSDQPIAEMWQGYFLSYVCKHLKFLMDDGKVPNIPVIYQTSTEWLKLYLKEFPISLNAWRNWFWLDLIETGLQSTRQDFTQLWDIYSQVSVMDNFTFSFMPDNCFDRVVIHEFTYDRASVIGINGSMVRLALGYTEAAKMREFLKKPVVVPPVIPNPETPPTPPTPRVPTQADYDELNSFVSNWSAKFK